MTEPHNDTEGATGPQRPAGWCSFCRRSYHDVGPLAEGPDQVLICYGCIEKCARVIEAQSRRRVEALRMDDLKCDVPECEQRVTAHFYKAERRMLVAEGHLCEEHGRPFLHDYYYSARTPGAGTPLVRENGVSFDPELVFFHDAHDQRGAVCMICLVEGGGMRRFGIGVGDFEGQALQVELQRSKTQQAVTHRAVATVAEALGARLLYAVVHRVLPPEEAGYVATLHFEQAGTAVLADVSASDAVILAVICDVPIIVSNEVLASLARPQTGSGAKGATR